MPYWQWKLHRLGHSLDVLWKLAVIKPPQEMTLLAAIDIIPAVEKAHMRGQLKRASRSWSVVISSSICKRDLVAILNAGHFEMQDHMSA